MNRRGDTPLEDKMKDKKQSQIIENRLRVIKATVEALIEAITFEKRLEISFRKKDDGSTDR